MLPERSEPERLWTPSAHPAPEALPSHLTLVEPGAALPRSRSSKDGRRADELGARLRRERERRHIPLAAVAHRTKIGIGLLQDLERNDVSRWPAGIYRRGFIRGYADAVGLDADLVAREFFEAFPIEDDRYGSPAAPAKADSGRRESGGQLRLTLAETNPGERRRAAVAVVVSRALAYLCDLGAIAALGAALWLVVDAAAWPRVACAAVCYYGAGVLMGGSTPGLLFVARSKRGRRRAKRAASPQPLHALP